MILPLLILLSATARLPQLKVVAAPSEDFCVECCSLYCAATPTLRVSSHIPPTAKEQYGSRVLNDGDRRTSWVVKGGAKQWFEFVFEPSDMHRDLDPDHNTRTGVDVLYICNGDSRSTTAWRERGRIHHMRLSIDGRDIGTVELADDARPQKVSIPATLLHRNTTFRFTIVDTYPGEKFDETAVSEVRLDGYGHH